MKYLNVFSVIIVSCFVTLNVLAQNPNESVWGLYAAGVGEKLKPGMDPCWITYTVGLTSNVKIQENVANGLMGVIAANVNWFEATQLQRRFS